MYSIADYGTMIADRTRVEAYAAALNRVARGAVVLDLGAGPGVFTVAACRAGARRVFCIEPDDAIQLAREAVRANGFEDRVAFFQDISTRVEIPERATVLVSDLRGVLPWFQEHIPAIADARRRLLAPGAVLIPQRDTLWAAPVESAEAHQAHHAVWADNALQLDLGVARRAAANVWRKKRMTSQNLLAPPGSVASLDYATVEDPNTAGEVRIPAQRPGVMHGWSLWFDTELAAGIGISNAPSAPELVYGHAFFPLQEPVEVQAGDAIAGKFRADLVGHDYVWTWETQICAAGGRPRGRFCQSTFYGAAVSPAHLQRRAAGHRPVLSEDGEIDRFILNLMGDGLNVGQIAARVAAGFPQRFATAREALVRVGDLSQAYSRLKR
ncbi:MAG TPA: class I SAM-dependent methyltransferase [Candidatus Acidoferrales bacterium]